MARYGKEHKEVTRRRIVKSAGRRLKKDGLDGSGVTTLMADAGLTNGAFYAHFASKDDLVAATIADQLQEQQVLLRQLADEPDGFTRFVRAYLSPGHRDDAEEGCPSGALLGEVARSSPAIRRAYSTGILGVADDLAALMTPGAPAAGRRQALGCIAILVGTLQLARAIDDPQESEAVLAEGARAISALLAAPEA
ncbi:TetR/AcrR family transcriptional regulator [Actinoplanes awajinensis]|uniref:TetR family transcriptional regulator n=1 Tax=Actinoplanes awajinensis subsp. mycoplanecinus TaxID=135947 RepID=A0A124G9N5_9ACTN|nr:TetR/AcrR family transcriptional regulator [Actinoplanes awajinensis]KUL29692.1 TetR family transcriptional regulator [Actinoplanes awajinensis subsp. mycoplanecinus]